ncbi:MAG: permease-like cell division protein FtsX [Candidatus Pacebacteria bacterium]|nr:permease-like cell division protein FtsX [Candidatus Paceibacterota bacterium]
MFFTSLKRILRAGWAGFTREGGMAAANIFILVMAVSVFTSLFLFNFVSQFMISEIQKKVDISVYFNYETPEEEILKIKEDVSKIPEVKEVEYVSSNQALESFLRKHQDDEILMESLQAVETNPFLASLNIKSYQASQYAAISSFFDNTLLKEKIQKIDYQERQPVIEKIFVLTSNIKKGGIVFSLILALIAILVVFNTIRLAIYNFREEIRIQKLVGASDWFIRGPFVAQGMFSGLFATLISLVFFTLLTWGLNSTIDNVFSGLNIFGIFLAQFWWILLLQIFCGVFLGTISSLIAVRRHLDV